MTSVGMMNGKQAVYDYLHLHHIGFEVTEHKAVCNMAELSDMVLPYPDCIAKNLFVRDDKKRDYYLITVRGDKRIDLKSFRRNNGTRPLSFASEEDLKNVLGVVPGAVTPFGILNDEGRKVRFFLDRDFLDPLAIVGIHPNDNTATVWIKAEDLLHVVKEHGNEVQIVPV